MLSSSLSVCVTTCLSWQIVWWAYTDKTDNCTKSVTINPKKLKIGGLPSTQTDPAPMAES